MNQPFAFFFIMSRLVVLTCIYWGWFVNTTDEKWGLINTVLIIVAFYIRITFLVQLSVQSTYWLAVLVDISTCH